MKLFRSALVMTAVGITVTHFASGCNGSGAHPPGTRAEPEASTPAEKHARSDNSAANQASSPEAPIAATAGADGAARAASASKQLVSFCATGDVPYAIQEEALLHQQVLNLPPTAEFLVHLGDIKRSSTPCSESRYQRIAEILLASKVPTFIVPGDNEWNDCLIPNAAWEFWSQTFLRFDRRWEHDFPVVRQEGREENFAFVRSGVVFIGVNVVGGRINDPNEWRRRLTDDAAWVGAHFDRASAEIYAAVVFGHANLTANHTIFVNGLTAAARSFKRPVLYLHGDGHNWLRDRPFDAQNVLRVQVDQGGIAPPVEVIVTDDPKRPFRFDRRK